LKPGKIKNNAATEKLNQFFLGNNIRSIAQKDKADSHLVKIAKSCQPIKESLNMGMKTL
jgi:hypothetical protein